MMSGFGFKETALLTFVCALWHVKLSSASKYDPALAMHCGKATQHRNIDTGDWISGDADCITGAEELLDYCKRVYPTLQISNVHEEDELVHVPSWCHVGSSPPCRGHGHKVKPIRCIVNEYAQKSVEAPDGCTVHHQIDTGGCFSRAHWRDTAAQLCQAKGKVISRPKMLKPCQGTDMWLGVQFLCCQKPDVAKPKPNKGKKVPAPLIQRAAVVTRHSDVDPICLQPKMVGLCRALLPSWHFNPDTRKCEFFHYGGCGGNKNNFQSEQECVSRCQPGKAVSDQGNSICGLSPDTGMCRGSFRRFFYDPSDGVCKVFVFGGCGGNGNNFMAKDECEDTCKNFQRHAETGMARNSPEVPVLSLGPVLPDETMDLMRSEAAVDSPTTRKPLVTTTEQFYANETSIDSEHDVFADKLEAIKAEHQDKVDKVLAQWEAEHPEPNLDDQKSADRLQITITSIEDEYAARISSLNQFHMTRMDSLINNERSKTLQNFLDQLGANKPKARHIVIALEKYIEVEQKDKSHILQHYYMATEKDFNKENIPEFKSRMIEIDSRVDKARNVLSGYPDIMSRIQDEVDEIFTTVPVTPVFDDADEQQEEAEEVIFEEEIDGGGIPDPDICTLKKEVGMCLAAFDAYYFDSEENKCKHFIYGGCGKNANNFETMEDCQAACPGKSTRFGNADVDGVLTSNDLLPQEKEFDIDDIDGQATDELDDLDYDPEDVTERESILDSDVDSQFDIYGNPINGLESDPQPLAIGQDDYYTASAGYDMYIWLGLSASVAVIVIVIIIIVAVTRKNRTRPPTKIVVDKPQEDPERELSPEEKQLLALQQNGYENPTYRFFEKQMA